MKSYSRQQYEALQDAQDQNFRGIKRESEDWIQANFIAWVDRNKTAHPKLDLIYSVPNGANKSKMARWVMGLTGLRSGVPDLHLPYPFHSPTISYNGLWIEFKVPKGVTSPNQKLWHEKLRRAEHLVVICTSWKQAANTVIDYLRLDMEKLV